MTTPYAPPEWAFEFHGHRCPFMPIGYRMGRLALAKLDVEREKDHGLFVFPELGEGHPQTCMMDGIQAATGATYGKVLMAKTFYGKLAATFYHPGRDAVRYVLQPDFIDEMGKHEFFGYRKRGIEPSEIPAAVTDDLMGWVAELPDETIFKVAGPARLHLRAGQGLVQQDQVLELRRVRLRPLRAHEGRRAGLHPVLRLRAGAAAPLGDRADGQSRDLHISAGLLQRAHRPRERPGRGLPARRATPTWRRSPAGPRCSATATARR